MPSYVARIAIPIVDDGDREGPESFFVRLSAADVAVSVVRDTAEVIIEDDGRQLIVIATRYTVSCMISRLVCTGGGAVVLKIIHGMLVILKLTECMWYRILNWLLIAMVGNLTHPYVFNVYDVHK